MFKSLKMVLIYLCVTYFLKHIYHFQKNFKAKNLSLFNSKLLKVIPIKLELVSNK